ncbi:Actin-related protein 5 [Hypsibius exemplaris]|uniref:Actin-related protein 5 n=1 Tax=Hypsibius exemplaris TaxID=2072580 RepID=A0A1W0WAP4_HYPEX|nr:Actin-related protein 5 [Hypsibius exemplaris]
MDSEDLELHVLEFRDEGATPLQIRPYTAALRSQKPVLVIDNGSWNCRAGWSTDPRPPFSFYNLLAKQKGKKGEQEPIIIGGDLGQIENLRWMLRSPFDTNVVVQFGYQEVLLDYVLANMGLGEETHLDMPVLMTEPLLNLAYSRKQMNELLFECYAFPHVAYGVDGAFSYFKNMNRGLPDGLVISVGNICTHLIPVLNNQMDFGHCRRIDLGGLNMTLYLQRLLQLKYPVHASSITITRMEEILQGYCYYAANYSDALAKWRNRDFYKASALYFQLPFQAPTGPVATQEEIDARREENAQRLRDMNRKRYLEKLAQDEDRLEKLLTLQDLVKQKGQKSTKDDLKALGVRSVEGLQAEIQTLTGTITRTKERLERKAIEVPKESAAETVVDPETLKGWVIDLKEQRHRLVDQRSARKQRKTDLGKRRSYASQQRMKIITHLASGRTQTGKRLKGEDTFGMNDEDWLVYREINKEAGDSDSEEERMQLDEIEGLLLKYDAPFRKEYEKTQALASGAPPKSPEFYRLEVGVERFRVPEILFQPSLVGVDQMGIMETIEYMMREYPEDVQKRLAMNVFVTGGPANLPGMDERIRRDLGSCLPFDSPFRVSVAGNPSLDAWIGAADWAASTPLDQGFLSRKDYLEHGRDYFKDHKLSNKYAVPPPKPPTPAPNPEAKKGKF